MGERKQTASKLENKLTQRKILLCILLFIFHKNNSLLPTVLYNFIVKIATLFGLENFPHWLGSLDRVSGDYFP
jgi:hypothetical protein